MADPAEQTSNIELLSPVEADNYLKAACLVLGSDKGARVEGVSSAPTPDSMKEDFKEGYLAIYVDDETGFIVRGSELGGNNHMTISQVALEPGMQLEDGHRVKSIVRLGDVEAKSGSYRSIWLEGEEENIQLKELHATGGDDKAQLAAEFSTLASDVKSALTVKLRVARPDLLDGIETTAEMLQAKRKKNGLFRSIGKLLAG